MTGTSLGQRWWLRVVLGLLALLVLGWGAASVDRCGEWTKSPPQVIALSRAKGRLRVGVARVDLAPEYPVTVAGYGPPRRSTREVEKPLSARALVLDVGGVSFAIVALDTLLVTAPVVAAVRKDLQYQVWVAATHTHSSLGGYDRRLVAEVAALGAYREEDERALVTAARQALETARASLAPARLELSQGESQGLSTPRTGGEVDQRLTRVRFLGDDGGARAQLLLLAAHPTLVDRATTRLDPDYPGRLALAAEQAGTFTVVLQSSGGNASAALTPGETVAGFAARAGGAFAALPPGTVADGELELGYAAVRIGLPRPDGSRILGQVGRAVIENALCDNAEKEVELAAVKVGPLSLLATPVEPARGAALLLEEQAGVTRVVGPANGYVGYVDIEQAVRERWGESPRQYFGPDFLALLAEGARLLSAAAGVRAPQ